MKPCRSAPLARQGTLGSLAHQLRGFGPLWGPPQGAIIVSLTSCGNVVSYIRATSFSDSWQPGALKAPACRELAMRHVLSAVVQNVPGVLAHISGMLASRGYNIDSLAVGETEVPDLSRMTFVIVGDDNVLEQVRKQLEKVVTVVQVIDVSAQDFIERDLMLIKVRAPLGGRRSEIRELAEIFRGRIVDVAAEEVIVEISGQEHKIESFIDLMRPFGIVELVRTGRIAMVRGERRNIEPSGSETK